MLSCDQPVEHDECSNVVKNKILIADDNPDLRKLLALRLKESRYDTVEAATGLEALEQARATGPDLILMDLAMPAGNGDEAIAWLKADSLTRDIPVIVLTAFLYGTLVNRAIAAGAAEILHKPFNLKSLDVVLQRHFVTPAILSDAKNSRPILKSAKTASFPQEPPRRRPAP
jgi:CheY-like chemotaxis protein